MAARSVTPRYTLGIAVVGALAAFLISRSTFELRPVFNNLEFWKISFRKDVKEQSLDPKDYQARAQHILCSTPLIDGHNDFPFLLRQQLQGRIYGHDFENEITGSHTDIQKMRKGIMGGQFWSVYVPCPEDLVPGVDLHDPNKRVPDFNEPNWAVRDTLEQIDLTKRFVARYSTVFDFCTNPTCVRRAHADGKIASMIGVEGGHQIGNSLGALRQFFELGVRYMTLTHNCDNAFGTSWVSVGLDKGRDGGLKDFGKELLREMNRLGMMVDLAHVSPNTMRDVLRVARVPVIFSHSGAYSVNNHLRNVPDDVLKALKGNGGIVMVPAISVFMNTERPEKATIEDMVDHILCVAEVAGWEHVGLGSDFDGSTYVVKGLEDTSQWPNLVARVLARNVTDHRARLLIGENLLRVWNDVEESAKLIQKRGELPCEDWCEGRFGEPQNADVPRLFLRQERT